MEDFWRRLRRPPPAWLVVLSLVILVGAYFYHNMSTSKVVSVPDYGVLLREVDNPEKLIYALFYLLPALQK